jgi:DNA-binding IclR family transcriptional regulator
MTALSPSPIFQVLEGHMAAKYLLVANELGLFEALSNDSYTLAALSDLIGVPCRTLRILVDALVAIGFVEREDDNYKNTPLTATFLSAQTPIDLRPILSLWDRLCHR